MDVEIQKKKWYLIVLYGLAAGLLDALMSIFATFIGFPLYIDTIFTMAVSFFSPISGCIAAFFEHVFCCLFQYYKGGIYNSLYFIICSITVVPFVRIYYKNRHKDNALLLAFVLIFLLTLAISVEGGIIFVFILQNSSFLEKGASSHIITSLFISGFPMLFSAIGGRIPVNFVDKAVSAVAAFFIAWGLRWCR